MVIRFAGSTSKRPMISAIAFVIRRFGIQGLHRLTKLRTGYATPGFVMVEFIVEVCCKLGTSCGWFVPGCVYGGLSLMSEFEEVILTSNKEGK